MLLHQLTRDLGRDICNREMMAIIAEQAGLPCDRAMRGFGRVWHQAWFDYCLFI
jgi:hypothetical protein